MDLHEILIKSESLEDEESPEPEYDSPNGSKWVVAVDNEGLVHVLSRPYIHDSFFECGSSAEDLGLPADTDVAPGVYEWICNIVYHRDWETGYVDDWQFEVIEEKLLWTWETPEVDPAQEELNKLEAWINGKADEVRDKEAQSDTGADKLG